MYTCIQYILYIALRSWIAILITCTLKYLSTAGMKSLPQEQSPSQKDACMHASNYSQLIIGQNNFNYITFINSVRMRTYVHALVWDHPVCLINCLACDLLNCISESSCCACMRLHSCTHNYRYFMTH